MIRKDIRWIQRLNNYQKALLQLTHAIQLATERDLSDLEQQGLIQAFEYTHELAWKTLKDLLEDRGNEALYGSKDVTRAAFKLGLVENGEAWMDMIKSRNKTSYTYNEGTTKEIVNAVKAHYFKEFNQLLKQLTELKAIELSGK